MDIKQKHRMLKQHSPGAQPSKRARVGTEAERRRTSLAVFGRILLAVCSALALVGCSLFESGSNAKLAAQQPVAPSSTELPRELDPMGRPARQKSPQRIAALPRVDQAKALIDAGDFVHAISHLEKTLAIDSTNPDTYFQLARAHHGLGNFRESLNFLEVAESLFGGEGVPLIAVWVLRGDNLHSLGQLPQARQSYERVLVVDPNNEKAAGRLRRIPRQT